MTPGVYRTCEVLLDAALDAAIAGGALGVVERSPCRLEPPEHPAFGDATSRVAMVVARRAGRPAADVARAIVGHVEDRRGWLERVEAGGPGFVNVRLSLAFWRAALAACLAGAPAAAARGPALVLDGVPADDPVAPRARLVADVLARALGAAGWAVERRRGPLDAAGAGDAVGPATRAVVLHAGRERDAARRAKAAFAAAGGHAGRLAGLALGPLEVRRRGRAVTPADERAALADPAVRFRVAGTPLAAPADVACGPGARAGVDEPLVSVRYALARIARLPRPPGAVDLDALGEPERACLRGVGTWPDVLEAAARRAEPDAIVRHAADVAAAFHRYYNRGRLLDAGTPEAPARRALADGVAAVLEAALALVLGGAAERG